MVYEMSIQACIKFKVLQVQRCVFHVSNTIQFSQYSQNSNSGLIGCNSCNNCNILYFDLSDIGYSFTKFLKHAN